MSRTGRQVALRVQCPDCAVVDARPDDVTFRVVDGIVHDVRVRCPRCGIEWCASEDPRVIALLHGFGVDAVRVETGEARLLLGDDRAVVSLRLLLDVPAFLKRRSAAPAGTRPALIDQDEDTDPVH